MKKKLTALVLAIALALLGAAGAYAAGLIFSPRAKAGLLASQALEARYGVTPEMLWEPESNDHVASESSMESVDIFETAMQNCFAAGKVWIDSILEGTL